MSKYTIYKKDSHKWRKILNANIEKRVFITAHEDLKPEHKCSRTGSNSALKSFQIPICMKHKTFIVEERCCSFDIKF